MLTMAIMYVALNLIIDILYGLIDPRGPGSKHDRHRRHPPAFERACRACSGHGRYVIGENKVTGFAFGLFIIIVLAAVIGPYIVPHDPLASDTAAALKGPSAKHWFGTDQGGIYVFSRVVVATRLDFFIAVASVALVFLMGGLGVAAGFFGGWTDRIVGRIADTIMAFPLFVLAMGIVAALGNTVQNIILATAIVNFPTPASPAPKPASAARPASCRPRGCPATANSASCWCKGFRRHHADHDRADVADDGLRHPQRRRPVVHRSRRSAADRGVGIMVAEGAAFMVSGEWWIAFFPGLALMVAVFCFNLLGDGLRDIVDPQRRE